MRTAHSQGNANGVRTQVTVKHFASYHFTVILQVKERSHTLLETRLSSISLAMQEMLEPDTNLTPTKFEYEESICLFQDEMIGNCKCGINPEYRNKRNSQKERIHKGNHESRECEV